jgi:predicted nucleotidyltransferase component of viral defense system
VFLHEDPEFATLVRVIATERGSPPTLVEKDYWVTHTLWAIEQTGLELWFKGGTSLSKAEWLTGANLWGEAV